MPDDKRGREKQARDAERRQRRRDVAAQLERMEETEPPVDEGDLSEFEDGLDSLAFPATGAEVVAAAGEQEVASAEGDYAVEKLIPDTDEIVFADPADVRARVQRPTIATAMKRIVEAGAALPDADLGRSQREAYEKTLRALKAIDAVDEDEGIGQITDWIVERIDETGALPGSRAVRRQAAKFCRASGYQVRNDEWLGV